MKMKYLLFLLCTLAAWNGHAQFETKISAFYPTLKEFKINRNQKTYYNDLVASGCVSGNCKNGEGIFVHAFGSNAVDDHWDSARLVLKIFKGKFSKNGGEFDGTLYSRNAAYAVTHKGSTNTYTPAVQLDLKNEDLSAFEIGTGQMLKSSDNITGDVYRWSGWMKHRIPAGSEIASYETFIVLNPEYAKIRYNPGGPYVAAQGRLIETGDMVSGRIDYSDGSRYEGFLYQGKFFGPGRYTDKSGKLKEGIWMLDSLTTEMEIDIPKEVYEFVDDQLTRDDHFNNIYKAGDWVMKRGLDWIWFGKTTSAKLDGPGVFISMDNPNISGLGNNKWLTYRAGIFENGELRQGMRVRDYLKWYFSDNTRGKYRAFSREESSMITGRFKNDQASGGCGKKIFFDDTGKPQLLLEGMFFPSKLTGEEFADGWLYINDWAGLRQQKDLSYWYSNRNVLDKEFPKDWLINAAKEANENSFCLPSIQSQSLPILTRLTQLGDSMLVVKKRQDAAAEAERIRLAEANRKAAEKAKACAKMLAEKKVSIGTTLYRDGFTGYIRDVDCVGETLTLVKPGRTNSWENTTEIKKISFFSLSLWVKNDKQYKTCSVCEGKGGESQTRTTTKTKELPFGYFSGIETRITKTITEKVWVMCGRCSGSGLALE